MRETVNLLLAHICLVIYAVITIKQSKKLYGDLEKGTWVLSLSLCVVFIIYDICKMTYYYMNLKNIGS